uniref:Uncharacterized protein n=1 Tax=viral metagenome TaxID=1070528 RepID=A0A6M3KMV0_9ZZZZ
MAIDLSRLIEEVLTMAKKRQKQNVTDTANARFDKVAMSERQRDAAKEAASAGHGYTMEKQKLVGTQEAGLMDKRVAGERGVQELRNTGGLAVQESQNTGNLARQSLMNIGSKYTADIGLQGDKYKADKTLEGSTLTSGATIKASQNRLTGDTARANAAVEAAKTTASAKPDSRADLFKAWAGSLNPTPESLQAMIAGHEKLFPKASATPAPALAPAPAPAPNPRLVPTAQDISKAEAYYNNPAAAPARPAAASFMRKDAPAVAPPTIASPTVAPARASLVQKDPIAERLALQRDEERKRAKKRFTDLMPTVGNRIDPSMSY